MLRSRPLTLTLGVALLTLTSGAVGLAGAEPVRIGLEAPLTGVLATLGDGMLKGAQLAAADLNAADGILGRQVEIVPIDDAGDPATGVSAATAAITEGLDGVVGPYNSGVGAETLPLFIEAGLVPIRLTSDASTSGLGYTLQPMSYQITPVAATAITDWLGAGSVAIVYDQTADYTVTIATTLQATLEAAGVEVVAFQAIDPGLDDYTDVVAAAVAQAPDVLYAAVYTPEGGLIAKAMHASGTDVACLADYATYDTTYPQIAGIEAAGACPVVGVPTPGDFPGAQPHVDAYAGMFGAAPGAWSPYTYDSVLLLAAGIEAAGGFDPAGIGAQLDGVSGWTGWTGSVTIDPETGDRDPATVVVVRSDAEGQLHVDQEWSDAVGAGF